MKGHESSKQRIIRGIREQYMGLRDLPRQSLANSVKTLADDLYAKDTHFIFELIQNAEDNAYAGRVRPTVRFRLHQRQIDGQPRICLVVENNETGFKKENVEALCQVGKSTKAKEQGYIGEKGIGFKSVFRITDRPAIHSNGFHFELPEKDVESGLGYIVPVWAQSGGAVRNPQETTIILPLKEGTDSEIINNALQDIAPETILFLSKLKTIEIDVDLPNTHYEIVIEKDDTKYPVVELTHLKRQQGREELETRQYWVAARDFDKPANINPEKRKDVTARTVSVAIPLDAGNSHPGKLFAYLPVWEKTGLPFLVNADFLLVSSREGIHEQEPWNLWLRDCIASAYAEAFLAIVGNGNIPLEQRAQAYASITTETHHQWLEPVVQEIQERLRQEVCVLTSPVGALAKPEFCRLPDSKWRELLDTPVRRPTALGNEFAFVHIALASSFSNLLKKIGVRSLLQADVVCCVKDSDWLAGQTDEWLVRLYQLLASFTRGTLANLRLVPAVMLGAGKRELLCGKDYPVYLRPDKDGAKALRAICPWMRKAVPVAFLPKLLQHLLDGCENHEKLRKWMTEELNVWPFCAANYCVDVLGHLQHEKDRISKTRLFEATRFLVEHAASNFKWEDLPIILADGRRMTVAEAKALTWNGGEYGKPVPIQALVVPESYDPKTGWQHIWRTADDRRHFVALGSGYEKLPKSIFGKIGAVLYPDMARIRICSGDAYKHPENESALSKCQSAAANSHYWDAFIETVQLPSLPKPMTNGCGQALLKWLQSLPNQSQLPYNPYLFEAGLKIKGTWFKYGEKRDFFDSPLLVFLRTHAWLPTTQELRRPDEAFADSDDLRKILGDGVPYVKSDARLSPQLIALLKIRDRVDNETLIGLLRQQKGHPLAKVDANLCRRIYHHVKDAPPAQISQEELIFVDKPTPGWHGPKTLIWKNRDSLFGNEFGYLEACYYDCGLMNFFKSLGVADDVTVDHCLTWLKRASEQKLGCADGNRIRGIYSVLAEKLKPLYAGHNPPEAQRCRTEFNTHPLLFDPASGKWFVSDHCLWPDKREVLGDQFAYLEPHYGELNELFVDRLQIKTAVDAQCYANRWLALQSESPPPPKQQLHKAFADIYGQLREPVEAGGDHLPDWLKAFRAKAKILGEDGQFHPPIKAVLNDDGECREILDKAATDYVCTWLPDNAFWREWESFFRGLSVRRLSEIVRRRQADANAQRHLVDSNRFLTQATVKLIAYWLFNEKQFGEDQLVEPLNCLRKTQEAEIDDLKVAFDIEGMSEPIMHPCEAHWEKHGDPPILLVRPNPSKMNIAEALCSRLLEVERKDGDLEALENLLVATDSDARQRIDKKQWKAPQAWISLEETTGCVTDDLQENSEANDGADELDPQVAAAMVTPMIPSAPTASATTPPTPGVTPFPPLPHRVDPATTRPSPAGVRVPPSGGSAVPTPPTSTSPPVAESATGTPSFRELLEDRFDRPGKTELDEEWLDDGDRRGGTVRNPEQRAQKLAEGHRQRLADEPAQEERWRVTERTILEPVDPLVREKLLAWYGGRCQVCGCGKTWPKRDGSPFFIAAHLIDREHARLLDDPANAICLCADHFAQWRHAAVAARVPIAKQIAAWRLAGDGGSGEEPQRLRFSLLGEEVCLAYCDAHALALQQLLAVAQEST